MRRKIDDHDAPTGLQDANGLSEGGLRIVEIMQHLMKEHRIEAALRLTIGKRKAVDVTTTHLRVECAGVSEAIARDCQHFGTDIDSDAAFDVRRKQFQHASR